MKLTDYKKGDRVVILHPNAKGQFGTVTYIDINNIFVKVKLDDGQSTSWKYESSLKRMNSHIIREKLGVK